ncbi:hypothetical protein Tco_0095397, partial [Tanacetum coccineum]
NLTLDNLRNQSRIGINKWYQSIALRNFDLEDMELESTNSGPTTKLPILKLGEYEIDPVTTTGEVVTTANVEVNTVKAPTTNMDELTLAQTLIEIKAAKPKAVTSAATTSTTTKPKARGVLVQELSEFKTTSSPSQASQIPQAKDKGKEKMVEPKNL